MTNYVRKYRIHDSKVFEIKKLEAAFFDPAFHFHSEYQLFLVLKGRGTRFVGDSVKPFKEGDLIFTGPNLPHVWKSDTAYFNHKDKRNTSGIVIYFHHNFLGDIIGQKEELEKLHFLLKKAERGLEIFGRTQKHVSGMMKKMLALNGVDSLIQLLSILNTIACSSESRPITQTSYIPLNNQTETDRMNTVYEYVMKNFSKKVSLEEIASLVNMTPTSFSRYFKLRVNKTFSDFLKERRIHHACKLLHEEKININEIAYQCGYNTLSNFNKQFKEVTGENPLSYKNKYLEMKISSSLF